MTAGSHATSLAQPDHRRSLHDPAHCIQRVADAITAHDLDALTACFAPDYRSEFPAHPARAFQGHAMLGANWSQFFQLVPDISTAIVRLVADDDVIWVEWEWQGTRGDGAPFLQRGVAVQHIQDEQIDWVRLDVEPVQPDDHPPVLVTPSEAA